MSRRRLVSWIVVAVGVLAVVAIAAARAWRTNGEKEDQRAWQQTQEATVWLVDLLDPATVERYPMCGASLKLVGLDGEALSQSPTFLELTGPRLEREGWRLDSETSESTTYVRTFLGRQSYVAISVSPEPIGAGISMNLSFCDI